MIWAEVLLVIKVRIGPAKGLDQVLWAHRLAIDKERRKSQVHQSQSRDDQPRWPNPTVHCGRDTCPGFLARRLLTSVLKPRRSARLKCVPNSGCSLHDLLHVVLVADIWLLSYIFRHRVGDGKLWKSVDVLTRFGNFLVRCSLPASMLWADYNKPVHVG